MLRASIQRIADASQHDGGRKPQDLYDLGGAGQDYLHFRAARTNPPTPDEVLNEFVLTPRKDLAKAAYEFAAQHLEEMPLPVTFGKLFPTLAGDAQPLVAAAFARK